MTEKPELWLDYEEDTSIANIVYDYSHVCKMYGIKSCKDAEDRIKILGLRTVGKWMHDEKSSSVKLRPKKVK